MRHRCNLWMPSPAYRCPINGSGLPSGLSPRRCVPSRSSRSNLEGEHARDGETSALNRSDHSPESLMIWTRMVDLTRTTLPRWPRGVKLLLCESASCLVHLRRSNSRREKVLAWRVLGSCVCPLWLPTPTPQKSDQTAPTGP